ncbi:hypothetical protein DY000_02003396 [Brassica cretica]|uniref:CASP-like protein n=1 Tax=Brassica cretica TaxID=69181 RepID=A0ABQ7C0G1_BRACR|nr:hypothetical protein DY000_02003396 [Brassica cretica]
MTAAAINNTQHRYDAGAVEGTLKILAAPASSFLCLRKSLAVTLASDSIILIITTVLFLAAAGASCG